MADRRIQAVLFDLNGVLTTWGGEVNDEVVVAVRRLRADGYATALVTNAVAGRAVHLRTDLVLGDLFDVVVDSAATGLLKPSPAVFRHALDQLGGIEPGRVVFLDDLAANVAGAVRAGLHGLLVDDPVAALHALDGLLDELNGAPAPGEGGTSVRESADRTGQEMQ